MIHPTATRRRQKGKITQQEKKIKMLRFKKRQKEAEIESQ
jgi:hypothetical protein